MEHHGGYDTTDVFFPLSWAEVQQYMPTEKERTLTLTPYAETHRVNLTLIQGKAGWWLRSPGPQQNAVAIVDSYGNIKYNSPAMTEAVRPSVWVDTRPENLRAEAYRMHEAANSTSLIGTVVKYGQYEIDNNRDNGPEPIEWVVIDEEGDRALLLSKYILDQEPYNSFAAVNITWENCTLRKWLNEQFFYSAFNTDEQSAIRETTLNNSTSQGASLRGFPGGNDTTDKIFILSNAELESVLIDNYVFETMDIFCGWSVWEAGLKETPYVAAHSRGITSTGSYTTRTPETLHVYSKGIAPAMWVDIKALNIEAKTDTSDYVPDSMQNSDATQNDTESTENNIYTSGKMLNESDQFKTIGNTVTFGRYEQDSNLNNGPESIEWIVLDVQDGKSLLLSKYGLDCQRYNSKFEEVTWETCTLRGWLNRDFLNAAFSDSEKKFITETAVDNSNSQGNPDWPSQWGRMKRGGKNTRDLIFILSYAEASDYFATALDRTCRPTEYAVSQGVYKPTKSENCWWWLRSPGCDRYTAAFVYTDGSLDYSSYVQDSSGHAVRPALWINLESDLS